MQRVSVMPEMRGASRLQGAALNPNLHLRPSRPCLSPRGVALNRVLARGPPSVPCPFSTLPLGKDSCPK